jgi:exopolysaccharide production protein ExoZ
MTAKTDSKSDRLFGLQYLRAVAAIGVVAFHGSEAAGFPIYAGATGVDIFFVLSGFLMVEITNDRSRPAAFLRNRIERVVPLYWIATTAMLACGLAGYFRGDLTLPNTIGSYLFIPIAHPTRGGLPLLTVGWTLNYEMMFYAIFALALFLPQRRRMPALSLVLAGIAAIGIAFHPHRPPASVWTDSIVLEFLAGTWIATLWRRDGPARPLLGWTMIAAGFLLLAPLAWLILETQRIAERAWLGIPAGLALLGTLQLERKGVREFRLPLLLGNASYSIYLWHIFVVQVVAAAAHHVAMPPWLIFTTSVAGGVTAGVLSYALLEKPIMAYFHRKRREGRGARHGQFAPIRL